MPKYEKFTRPAKLALADIFVVIEEKFIQLARVEDILVIRPDLEHQAIICGIARYENMQKPIWKENSSTTSEAI